MTLYYRFNVRLLRVSIHPWHNYWDASPVNAHLRFPI